MSEQNGMTEVKEDFGAPPPLLQVGAAGEIKQPNGNLKVDLSVQLRWAYENLKSPESYSGLRLLKLKFIIERCEAECKDFKSALLLNDDGNYEEQVLTLGDAIKMGFGLMGMWEARRPLDDYFMHADHDMPIKDQVQVYRAYFLGALARRRLV